MQRVNGSLVYSPSDLNAFLENECVTWLDRYNLEHPGDIEARRSDARRMC